MRQTVVASLFLIAASSGVNSVLAADLMIFPAEGQSDEQLEQDKFLCTYGCDCIKHLNAFLC